MDLMPPIMRQYVTGLNLSSSALQILDFVDEETLQAALEYLQSEPSLNLLVRDFEMSRIVPPSLIPSLPSFASLDQTLLDLLDQTQDMDTSNINFTALEEIALQAIGNSSSNTGRKLMQSSSSAVTTSASSISDPFYLNRSQYYIDQINMTGAWKYTTGSPTIVVAVIDTGADLAHPDLADRLWINKGEIPGNGIDDDGNGYIDDVYGYDFAGQCNQPGGCGGQCNSVRCCVSGNSTLDFRIIYSLNKASLNAITILLTSPFTVGKTIHTIHIIHCRVGKETQLQTRQPTASTSMGLMWPVSSRQSKTMLREGRVLLQT